MRKVVTGICFMILCTLGLVTLSTPAQANHTFGPEQNVWGTVTPTTPADTDPQAVTLGAEFQSSKAGIVKGVRFYKGTGNTGTHVGKLWTASGTLLASVTFSGESASGWQRADFATPVSINANTTYVVGYVAPVGRYAAGTNLSTTTPKVSGDLTETRGVYVYSTTAFPTLNFQNSHYYADLVFQASVPDAGLCSDGVDNDSDGKTDYPTDPGCSSATDNDETDPAPTDTTPPDTTITSGPAAGSTTSNATESFAFTSSETGSSFQCSVDGAAYSACTSPKSVTVTSGAHTFAVKATDAAGNTDATPAQRSWTYQPAPVGDGTTAAATFSWGTSVAGDEFNYTGAPNATKWSVYNGPGHAGNGTRTPTAWNGDGSVMRVTGDAAGNTGGMSAKFDSRKYGRWETRMRTNPRDSEYHPVLLLWPDSENWPCDGEVDYAEGVDDTTKMNTYLHYSCSNLQTSSSRVIDTTQWHNYAVEWTPAHIKTYIDGVLLHTDTNTSHLPPGPMHSTIQLDWFPDATTTNPSWMEVDWTRVYNVDTTTPPTGPETVTVPVAADTYTDSAAPTANKSAVTPLVVDALSPVASAYLKFDLGAYAGRTVQSASLKIKSDTNPSNGLMNVKYVADDSWTAAGVNHNNQPTRGSVLGTFTASTASTAYTVPLTASVVQGDLGSNLSLGIDTASSDGLQIMSAEGVTKPVLEVVLAGSTGGGSDTTPPDTTITGGPSGDTTATSASFNFTSTETGSTFECKLDTGTYASCTSPKAYSGLAVGSHTFTVRATDAAGNVDASPATRTWNITTTTPPAGGTVSVAAVGDMNPTTNTSTTSPSGKNAAAISTGLSNGSLSAFLALGDFQYDKGTCADLNSYWKTLWGGVISKTYWTAGPNHDVEVGVNDDVDKFMDGQCAGSTTKSLTSTDAANVKEQNEDGFVDALEAYSYDLGTKWHVVVGPTAVERFPTAAGYADSTAARTAINTWIDADMAAATAAGKYLIFVYHDPYFTSDTSSHGRFTWAKPWLDTAWKYKTRILLSGSQHNYERSCPLNNTDACVTDGMTQFQVSTGGIGLRSFTTSPAYIVKRFSDTWGHLKLDLKTDGGYDYTFNAVSGPGTDSGTVAAPAGGGGVAQTSNCAPDPSACGFPDVENTGVTVPDSSLTTYNGSVDLTTAGQVFQNAIVNGHLTIAANNVTVKNVRVLNSGEDCGICLAHTQNATISDVEIKSPTGQMRLLAGIKDVYGDATGTLIQRIEIVRAGTGIQTHEGIIEDSYIHNMAMEPGDHVNGTTSNGSTVPLTIRHNTIFNEIDQTDAVSFFQDFGCEANRTVNNNLLAGGGYTVYGGDGTFCITHDIKITNNRFSRIYYPNSGYYGPLAHLDNGTGNAFTGNVWDDTGAAL